MAHLKLPGGQSLQAKERVTTEMAKRIEPNQWSNVSAQQFFSCIHHPAMCTLLFSQNTREYSCADWRKRIVSPKYSGSSPNFSQWRKLPRNKWYWFLVKVIHHYSWRCAGTPGSCLWKTSLHSAFRDLFQAMTGVFTPQKWEISTY